MRLEELAYHQTALGELVLRRRPEPLLGNKEIFEVKLGDEFLMSSLFTKGEKELAYLGLEEAKGELDVIVGGLGLGYTAAAALENERVSSLIVIDAFAEVIGWHENHLVPLGKTLSEDPRCRFLKGDFFELAAASFVPAEPTRRFDAVLVDIDHSPKHYLDGKNETFYSETGLVKLREQIVEGGVFALWSDDPPDQDFNSLLELVFGESKGHTIEFENPYTHGISLNSVYVAKSVGNVRLQADLVD